MILIQLFGGHSRKLHMEFHPRLTIVEGLGTRQRYDLAERIRGAISGKPVGFRFEAEVEGQPQELSPEAVDRIGLAGRQLENIIDPDALPGHRPTSAGTDGRVAAHAEARAAVTRAEHRFRQLQSRHELVSQTLPTKAEVEELESRHMTALQEIEAIATELRRRHGPAQMSLDEKQRRVARARQVEVAILSRIEELRRELEPATDPRPGLDGNHPDQLADEWTGLDRQLSRHPAIDSMLGDEAARSQPRALVQAKSRRADLYSHASALAGAELPVDEVEDVLRQPGSQVGGRSSGVLHKQLAVALLDLNDLRRQLSVLVATEPYDESPEAHGSSASLSAQLERAKKAEVDLSFRLSVMKDHIDRYEALGTVDPSALRRDLGSAEEALDEARFRLARFSTPKEKETSRVEGETPVTDEDLEMYVMSRAASLRKLTSNGETVPLVINGSFDTLSGPQLRRMLTTCGRISGLVQVVYLSSTDQASEWASGQEESLTAVVRLEVG